MSDSLNKLFAVFAMYKSNLERESRQYDVSLQIVCLNCGASVPSDEFSEEPQFCSSCGKEL